MGGEAGEVKRGVFGKADAVVFFEDDAAQGEAEREAEEVERDHLRFHVFRCDFGDEGEGDGREQQFGEGVEEDGEGKDDEPHHYAGFDERHEAEVAEAEDEERQREFERGFRLHLAHFRPQGCHHAGKEDDPETLQ